MSATRNKWIRRFFFGAKEVKLEVFHSLHHLFSPSQVIQHMLALLAIAFGKDVAAVTVISLEPFLEASEAKPETRTAPLPQQQGTAATLASKTPIEVAGESATVAPYGKKNENPPQKAPVERELGAQAGMMAKFRTMAAWALCHRLWSGVKVDGRRRYSSLVLPLVALTKEEVEAAERQETVKTAARLGCAVGGLTKRQQAMLMAKV